MKNLLIHFAISLLNNLIEIRRYFWKYRKKLSKTITLKLSKEDKYTFLTEGELVGIVYAHQPKITWNKGFEHRTVKLMKEVVKEGMVVIDIGANIGMYTLLLSKLVGAKGKVYAFEPDSKTFKILQKNVEMSGYSNIEMLQLALSDTSTFVTLKKPDDSLGDAFHYIQKVESGTNDNDIVQAITLDEFLENKRIREVGFIKIDIEGAEFLCLKGAEKLLSNEKPFIVSECYEDYLNRFGNSLSDIIVLMDKFGFQSKNYDFQQWFFSKRQS